MKGPEHFEEVKSICDKYHNYPFIKWRNLFIDTINYISEYEKKELIQKQFENIEEKDKVTSLDLQCVVKDNEIEITHYQQEDLQIYFYEIDLEIMFSMNPFSFLSSQYSAFNQPNHIVKLSLDSKEKRTLVPLKDFSDKNIFIEVQREGKERILLHHVPSSFVHLLEEEEGKLKLYDPQSKSSISKAYVKVFARSNNGGVVFFKDGYSDIRGQFDLGSF